MMKLYTYWRSTTSYRIRIALNIKAIDYESISVNLVQGEQNSDDFKKINPAQGVPALVLDDGSVLTQSMAILEWLDESYPVPALLPEDPIIKARARAAALSIATDIHPVNNLRVIGKLKSMGHSQDDAVAWMNDWMVRGFTAFQRLIEPHTPFCCGDSPGIADLCLVPQLYNARRWGCDLSQFRRLVDIETLCLDLPAFDRARPEVQPDAG